MSETKVCFCIDWLRFTLPVKSANPPLDYYPIGGEEWEECAPYGSYNTAVRNQYMTMLWHTAHPNMMVMTEMNGQQLSLWRTEGGTETELIQWMHDEGGKPTRIDFAIDFMSEEAMPEHFAEAWQTPKLITHARKMTHINSQNGTGDAGQTVYLGSRQSTRMVRVYHKGKQLGIDLPWVRCELEWKKERAVQMGNDMQKEGVYKAGLAHVRAFITSTDIQWFECAFDQGVDVFDVDRIPRRETDHDTWVREVCLPAVADAVKNGVPGVLEALRGIVSDADNQEQHGPRLLPR